MGPSHRVMTVWIVAHPAVALAFLSIVFRRLRKAQALRFSLRALLVFVPLMGTALGLPASMEPGLVLTALPLPFWMFACAGWRSLRRRSGMITGGDAFFGSFTGILGFVLHMLCGLVVASLFS